ncbi:MAG TPA: bifunctional diguanylate cyclase/phosphodiesterase [Steroidobacteraceae bacterium]|nr:bifunctional diguanylate cyclase/phosphodiesterase [Steroidobacteraceae bacterium]
MDPINELEWLLEVAPECHRDDDGMASIERLIATSIEHLACVSGALVLTSGVSMCVRGSSAGSLGRGLSSLRHLEKALIDGLGSGDAADLERHLPPAPLELDCKVITVPVTGRSGQPLGALFFIRGPGSPHFDRGHFSVAQLLSRQAAAALEAQLDPATGLYTRAALHSAVGRWAARADRQTEHCVLCLKVDHLQVLNETAGFETGDRLIACVASLLSPRHLPHGALAARISGNEFAVALPRHGADAAGRRARMLQQAVAEIPCLPAQAGIPVAVSCGIASFSGAEFAHALTLAEVACRTARDRGPGRIETYADTDSSMARRYADTMTLGRLRDALQNDRLTLYAQKIAPLKPQVGRPGYELLLRALDDTDTRHAPAWLFSAAQRYQMEPDVDRWVIEHALEEAGGFRAALADSRVSLSINVSSTSLIDWEFFEQVRSRIRRSRLAPELLVFEITETAAVASVPAALASIEALRAMGCRLALDDFGTGVNSLKVLKTFAPDRVKIDGSFVADMLTNEQSAATIHAIVTLAQDLRIETVAEYAETPQLIARLREVGVDYVQGDGVEKPRPLPDVLESLGAETFARNNRRSRG